MENQNKTSIKEQNQIDVSQKNNQTLQNQSTGSYCFGHKENEDIWKSFLVEKMFAHRGLWDEESPENSISAFQKAIDKGYGIELDVNPIQDGTPVVFHDSKMSRMTGLDKYIVHFTKEELETTTLLNSKEKIPTFKQVLDLVDGKVPLLIEIKTQEKVGELEQKIFDLLKDYKGEFAIQSFNPYQLEWFYKNAPKIWRGQLSGFFKDEKMSLFKKFVLKRLGMRKISHQDFVNYDLKNLPNRFTRRLRIPLLSYTINNQTQYTKALKYSDNVVFQGFEPKI